MNKYLKAILPGPMKLITSLLMGALFTVFFIFSSIIAALTSPSGDIIANLQSVIATGVPRFVTFSSLIYAVWSFIQLLWAISHREEKIKPERIPEQKIEQRVEEMKKTMPNEIFKEPVPEENVDRYFKKYVKEDELHPENEEK